MRAGLVDRPQDYQWSSYSGYAQVRRAVAWVCYDRVLAEFGRNPVEARKAYCRFVREGVETPPASPLAKAVGGMIVGSGAFVTKIRQMLESFQDDAGLPQLRNLHPSRQSRPKLRRIVEEVAAYFGHDPSQWRAGKRVDDASRALATYLARRRFGYPAGKVAEALGYRSHGGVLSAVKRIESAGTSVKQIAEEIENELMGSERR